MRCGVCACVWWTWEDVLPLHRDESIPVHAGVLVMQAQGVNDLVAEVAHAARVRQIYRLDSSTTANEGRAPGRKFDSIHFKESFPQYQYIKSIFPKRRDRMRGSSEAFFVPLPEVSLISYVTQVHFVAKIFFIIASFNSLHKQILIHTQRKCLTLFQDGTPGS